MLIKHSYMSNTIPDQKVTITFLAYFARRLLDLSEEMKAARAIQSAWRRHRERRRMREIETKYRQKLNV